MGAIGTPVRKIVTPIPIPAPQIGPVQVPTPAAPVQVPVEVGAR